MLVAIDGVDPLVVAGKVKEHALCVSTVVEQDATGMANALGCVQRAMPLII
ncbi:MAG: hypothetical protein M3N82_06365 [Pseudomonadota bacterium]|nr:hypothetical protein [Pseudomonadota bacterium]